MENIEQMRVRHIEEIEKLQKKCKHKNISDWQEYCWAIGHFSHYVKTCKFCGKIVKEQKPKYEFIKIQDESCGTQKLGD